MAPIKQPSGFSDAWIYNNNKDKYSLTNLTIATTIPSFIWERLKKIHSVVIIFWLIDSLLEIVVFLM